MAERAGNMSPGTIKNVERGDRDVLEKTLAGIDTAFEWPEGTARNLLLDLGQEPALPRAAAATQRVAARAAAMPRRLLAELEGHEVHDVRVRELGGGTGKIVIALVGDADDPLEVIRASMVELDDLFRKFHSDQ